MKMYPFEIIFVDIDWTLLSHSKKPPRFDKVSLRFLNKLHKDGIKIVLATARPYHSVKDVGIFKYLKPDGLILSSGSLSIYKDEIIHEDDLSIKDFELLSKVALKYQGNLEGIKTYDSFIIREMNDPIKYVFEAYPSRIPSVEGIHRKKVNKATLYFYKEDYEKVMEEVPTHLHYYRFHDNAVDVSTKVTNKGVAVKHMLNYLSITPKRAVAIGDEKTDSFMFDEVSFSVAMKNATDEVKKHAKYVTKHVNRHGVKYILKRIIKHK